MYKTHLAGQYFLNHLLKKEELELQVAELARAGYQSIFAHARAGLRTPYLSESWFEAVDAIAASCNRHGVHLAIWDEDYYPSPTAGNRVRLANPELQAQALEFSVFEAPAGTEFEQLFQPFGIVLGCYAVPEGGGEILDITKYTGSVQSRWRPRAVTDHAYSNLDKIGTPHWRTGLCEKHFGVLWNVPPEHDYTIVAVQQVRIEGGHNTDILNPETTRAFLEFTHEAYLKRYGEEAFGTVIDASFLDEPNPGSFFPWTGRFPAEFRAEHGYNLLPLLPHLAIDIDERTPLVRHCYRKTQMRLMCDSYLGIMQQWCARHRIQSIGHLTRTEWLSVDAALWPNELRCCKYLDIPCTDPLGALTAWPDTKAYHTGLKVASSAAALFGKAQAGSDALAVGGSEICIRDLKFALDYQLALGITYFNIHGLNYSLDGARKDETPPSLFHSHSEWPMMKHWLAELKRNAELLSEGEAVRPLAVLYPSTGFGCAINAANAGIDNPLESAIHALSEQLLSHQKDFDFIDEITLAEQFRNPETFLKRYPAFIVHSCAFIEAGSARILEAYAARGGRLQIVGGVPELLGEITGRPRCSWEQGKTHSVPELSIDALPGPALDGDGAHDIFLHRRNVDGEIRTFLFNRADRPFHGMLDGEPVEVPARGSAFAGEPDPAKGFRPEQELGAWRLEFESNSCPLGYWSVAHPETPTRIERFDLTAREKDPMAEQSGEKFYQSRFLHTGEVRPLHLVIEPAALGTHWSCRVNGVEIPRSMFHSCNRYDHRIESADISGAVRSGSTPTLNVVEFTASCFEEALCLSGDFQAEFRHGHASLPYLTGCDRCFELEHPVDYRMLGFGSFSGRAVYSRTLEIAERGLYRLELGRVEDAAIIEIDGREFPLFSPPYAATFELKPGLYPLKVTVYNGPGNRDRLSGLPAGMLGPVVLLKN